VALAAVSGQRAQNFGREKPAIEHRKRIVGNPVDQLFGIQHFVRTVLAKCRAVNEMRGQRGQGHATHLGIAGYGTAGIILCPEVFTGFCVVMGSQGGPIHREQHQSLEDIGAAILTAPMLR